MIRVISLVNPLELLKTTLNIFNINIFTGVAVQSIYERSLFQHFSMNLHHEFGDFSLYPNYIFYCIDLLVSNYI